MVLPLAKICILYRQLGKPGRPLAAASYSSASSWQKIKTDQASERMRCMIRTILCALSMPEYRDARSGPRTRLNGRFACKSG